MHRRQLLIGSACLASAGLAFALTPRRRLSRLGGASLDQITPRRVGDWSSRDVSGLAPPSTADSLVAKLYDQVVERVYAHEPTGDEITMLLAHGASQTNELQLHRPEVCYPAFGYRISDDRTLALRVAVGVELPARRLVAESQGRQENIIYTQQPPPGVYTVRVDAASLCGQADAQWRVTATTADGTLQPQFAQWEATDSDTRGSHGLGAGRLAFTFTIQ